MLTALLVQSEAGELQRSIGPQGTPVCHLSFAPARTGAYPLAQQDVVYITPFVSNAGVAGEDESDPDLLFPQQVAQLMDIAKIHQFACRPG